MRWDKKYPEWCPPSSPTILVPSHPSLSARSGIVAVAAFVLSPFFACTPAPAVLPAPARTSAPAASSSSSRTSGSADPLGYRVRIPGLPPSCHWSAPLPSTLCQPPPAANLCHIRPLPTPPCVFVLRQLPPLSFLSSSPPPGGRLRREYEYHTLPPDSPFRLSTYSRLEREAQGTSKRTGMSEQTRGLSFG